MEKSPLKAIRAKCLDCTCGQANEVKNCPIKSCPLYDLRFGKSGAYPLNDRRTEASCGRTAQIGSSGKEIIE